MKKDVLLTQEQKEAIVKAYNSGILSARWLSRQFGGTEEQISAFLHSLNGRIRKHRAIVERMKPSTIAKVYQGFLLGDSVNYTTKRTRLPTEEVQAVYFCARLELLDTNLKPKNNALNDNI